MKKSIIALILLIIAVFNQTMAFAAEHSLDNYAIIHEYSVQNVTFSDIGDELASKPWYNSWVRKAYEYGIIQGVGDSKFDPQGTLTAAQAITIGARIHSIYKYGSNDKLNEFNATHTDTWYAGSVEYAKAEGLIGTEFDTVLNNPISRASMVHAWFKILQPTDLKSQNNVTGLPDMTSSDSYYSEVISFYNAGILTGSDDKGTFNPNSNITRAECSAIFIRLIETQSRSTGNSFTASTQVKSEVTTPLLDNFKYAIEGNIDSVPGGKATADISNWRKPNELYELAMKDEVAVAIQKSIVQTVRLEKSDTGMGYVSFSVPKVPEGYGVYFNFSALTDHIERGDVRRTVKGTTDLNTVGKGGNLNLLEGSYRFEIGGVKEKETIKSFDLTFKVQYMHKSSNILPGETKGPTYQAPGTCVALRGMNTDNITDATSGVTKDAYTKILDLWN